MKLLKNLPRVNILTLRKVFIYVIFGVSVYCAGYYTAIKGFRFVPDGGSVIISREKPAEYQDVDFALFWKVWDVLKSDYFDKTKLNTPAMVYGAISGLVNSLEDPYTVFLNPNENKMVNEDLQGNFDGVGIQIGFRDRQLVVIAPLPGTPAEKAGIKAGDFIIGIKDEKKEIDLMTTTITLPEAVSAIRGRQGTWITLTIVREGIKDPLTFKIIRGNIDVPSVSLKFKETENKKIAHLSVLKFGGETKKEWDRAVAEILKNDTAGIILDLRNNPGGYMQGAVDLAGDFLPSDSVVVVEETADHQKEEYKTKGLSRLESYPLIILVNKGTASASEILAAALKEHIQTKIVGETTFGKGTIQEPRELTKGSGLHITIARWLTPKGNWVNEKGLAPDVASVDNEDTQEDEMMIQAEQNLLDLI